VFPFASRAQVEELLRLLTGLPPDPDLRDRLLAATDGHLSGVLERLHAAVAAAAMPRDALHMLAGSLAAPDAPLGVFRREGDAWTVIYDRHLVRLRSTRGAAYLARLLAAPGVPILAIELAGSPGRLGHRGAENARQSVTKALGATIARIGAIHLTLGHHLEDSIRRGTRCRYAPSQGPVVRWDSGGTP
jgi:hypothetical protein